jgi:hypothetical protein
VIVSASLLFRFFSLFSLSHLFHCTYMHRQYWSTASACWKECSGWHWENDLIVSILCFDTHAFLILERNMDDLLLAMHCYGVSSCRSLVWYQFMMYMYSTCSQEIIRLKTLSNQRNQSILVPALDHPGSRPDSRRLEQSSRGILRPTVIGVCCFSADPIHGTDSGLITVLISQALNYWTFPPSDWCFL